MLSADFTHAVTGLSVNVSIDARAAWAFMLDLEGNIVADTWLFNVADAPGEIDLNDASAQFMNSSELSLAFDQPVPQSADVLDVEWILDGELLLADLYVNGVLVGRLSPGSSPGWSAFAKSDGPLALKL